MTYVSSGNETVISITEGLTIKLVESAQCREAFVKSDNDDLATEHAGTVQEIKNYWCTDSRSISFIAAKFRMRSFRA